MRKFKDITLGDGYYSSLMVNSTMGCQHECQMEGKKCDYVEIKQGEVGILCLLYHGKDIIIEEQEDATVLQKICPIGMVMFFTVHVQQLIFDIWHLFLQGMQARYFGISETISFKTIYLYFLTAHFALLQHEYYSLMPVQNFWKSVLKYYLKMFEYKKLNLLCFRARGKILHHEH